MDNDARESAMHFDAQERDPKKKELFQLIYQIDALVRTHRAALPDAAYHTIDGALAQMLEAVRGLPTE